MTTAEKLQAKVPAGPIAEKWDNYKGSMKLVNPNNKRKFKVIVVGSGLAGASAAATMAELGYQVDVFTFHDSPRRAHSIAAQGGINAAKNYKGDGDSIYRLFYDTVKGGDFRAREGNVYRLAQVSVDIIDQMVAQGVPFAREYGGLLDNRSFGGAQVSRTFYARGQTGQQLLIGAYQALERQVGLGTVKMHNRHEMLELIVVDDASPDDTVKVANSLPNVRVCVHPANRGYGANQKTCYREALARDAEYVVMVHPDYQYDSRVVGAAVEILRLGICDVVLGSRIRTRREALDGGMPRYKYIANRCLTFMENVLLGQNLGDFHSGFRAYRRKVLETIPYEVNSDDFVFDSQFLAQAVYFGFKLGDIPVPVRYFDEASSINFRRSVKYGLSTLTVLCQFWGQKLGLLHSPLFRAKSPRI